MKINAHGRVESTQGFRELLTHYKKEGYNNLMKVTTDRFGSPVRPSHYWAVDWQVFDTTVTGLVRYKVVYVGTPETFKWWQEEIEDRLAAGLFKPLQMRPADPEQAAPGDLEGNKFAELMLRVDEKPTAGKKETIQ